MRAMRALLSTVLKSALNESVVFSTVLSRSPGIGIEDPKKAPIYRRGAGWRGGWEPKRRPVRAVQRLFLVDRL